MSRSHKGFTLIETLMAMLIMATGLLLLSQSWSAGFTRTKKSQQNFEVAALLQRKVAEIELEYDGKPIDSIDDEKEGEFEDIPDYTWKMTSKKLEFPDISSLLASQDGGVDAFTESVIKQLTDTLSKSIKEVKVTVIYKKGSKPLEYSVTTYFVNYDAGVSMGAPGG